MIKLFVALLLVAAPAMAQEYGFDQVSVLGSYQGVVSIRFLNGEETSGAVPSWIDWRKVKWAVIVIQISQEKGGQYYLKALIHRNDVYDLVNAKPIKSLIGITGSHKPWRDPETGEYEIIIDAGELVVINK